MDESNMTESLPKVRCTPAMRESLVAFAQASVSTDLADHIRAAVQSYVDGGIDLTDEELGRVQTELNKVFGNSVAKSDVVAKLIQYWDMTKKDSYGYSTFA